MAEGGRRNGRGVAHPCQTLGFTRISQLLGNLPLPPRPGGQWGHQLRVRGVVFPLCLLPAAQMRLTQGITLQGGVSTTVFFLHRTTRTARLSQGRFHRKDRNRQCLQQARKPGLTPLH